MSSHLDWIRLIKYTILLCVILSGCTFGSQRVAPDAIHYEPFIPPTLVPTPLPTEIPTPTLEAEGQNEPSTPGSEVVNSGSETSCIDNLTFISDLTIPDGTVVVPGSTLDKQWEVENSGTCNWNEQYTLRLISGPQMGADPEQEIIPARSGSRVTLRIVFNAPEEPGSYHSAWQVYNSEGNAFGDPFFIDIVVE